MAHSPYDLLVIGAGSAGFNAARVASHLGQRVALVDGARKLSGLCILRGCMPSKTLIYAAEVLHRAQIGKDFGLKIPRAGVDMPALQARKKRLIGGFADHRVKQIHEGKFDLHRQTAHFVDAHTVELGDGRRLAARHILISTGSKPAVPAIPGLAESGAWTSDQVLDLDFVPESVIVLGGGVVACELAQFLKPRIGSEVTLIQRSPTLLRGHPEDAAKVVQQAFTDEGLSVVTGTELERVRRDRRGFTVSYRRHGRRSERRAAHLFNALGREADTGRLNLAAAGIKLQSNGEIAINRWQQTSVPHIYAAGDCCGPVEIVHLAVQQGELAARHAARVRGAVPIDYSLLLNVIFTDPQMATIGRSERELDKKGIPYLSASYPFDDHGKSMLMEALYGYVKVIAEPRRGRILGAEIVGQDAGELIHCFSGPMAMRATAKDLLRAPWYHPTLSEIVTYPLEEIEAKIEHRRGKLESRY